MIVQARIWAQMIYLTTLAVIAHSTLKSTRSDTISDVLGLYSSTAVSIGEELKFQLQISFH